MTQFNPKKLRNVAIIAHVDHGKTTIVDGLLKQSQTFRDNQAEMEQKLLMDSGDQESERGITITAKHTAVYYQDYKINIIDTPGHADFGSEVERTLSMADGVLLVVDAQEGAMPQTKFVLKKALELGLTPVVIINKIDKPGREVAQVEDKLADLFLELASDEAQLQYPTYYAVGRDGKAWRQLPNSTDAASDFSPLFKAIIHDVPAPQVDPEGKFQLQVASLDHDSFLGKYCIGKIRRGKTQIGQDILIINPDGKQIKTKIDRIFTFHGLEKESVQQAVAGDIVALTGLEAGQIGDTITDPENPETLPSIDIAPPTISMYLGPNTSPLKGRDGEFTTSRQLGERLNRELETNIGLQVENSGIGFKISGRGELHLSVLIEAMRREGYECEVGRPEVITITKDGVEQEPIEELHLEIDNEFMGAVSQELGARKAELLNQENIGDKVRLIYKITTRAMIGLSSLLMTLTRGTVVSNSLPLGCQPLGEQIQTNRLGALIATEPGLSTPYALEAAEARGRLFVGPAEEIYQGMIVGEHNRYQDLEINVCKEKHLTNMRSKSSDGTVQLTPFTNLSLEQSIDFLNNDELLEVTPKHLRLRKKFLLPHERKRAHKN